MCCRRRWWARRHTTSSSARRRRDSVRTAARNTTVCGRRLRAARPDVSTNAGWHDPDRARRQPLLTKSSERARRRMAHSARQGQLGRRLGSAADCRCDSQRDPRRRAEQRGRHAGHCRRRHGAVEQSAAPASVVRRPGHQLHAAGTKGARHRVDARKRRCRHLAAHRQVQLGERRSARHRGAHVAGPLHRAPGRGSACDYHARGRAYAAHPYGASRAATARERVAAGRPLQGVGAQRRLG